MISVKSQIAFWMRLLFLLLYNNIQTRLGILQLDCLYVQQGFAKHIVFSKNQFRSIALGEVFLFSIWSLNWAESCFLLSHFVSVMFVLTSRASAVKLLPVIVELCNFLSGIGYFWRICNQKVFSERCDFVFPFWWKARTRNFSIVAKSSCLSLKETMPFFSFHLKAVEHFSILLGVCFTKMFTNWLQRQWSPGNQAQIS